MTIRSGARALCFSISLSLMTTLPASPQDPQETASLAKLTDELRAVEVAFAATMKDRDLGAFSGFLSAEVVFFTGNLELRGKQAVSDAWAQFFEGEKAPFSWAPDAVSVLDSGTLGLSSGPVLDPDGNRIGTFNSVWRRLPGGNWEIIFDRGCPPCE